MVSCSRNLFKPFTGWRGFNKDIHLGWRFAACELKRMEAENGSHEGQERKKASKAQYLNRFLCNAKKKCMIQIVGLMYAYET